MQAHSTFSLCWADLDYLLVPAQPHSHSHPVEEQEEWNGEGEESLRVKTKTGTSLTWRVQWDGEWEAVISLYHLLSAACPLLVQHELSTDCSSLRRDLQGNACGQYTWTTSSISSCSPLWAHRAALHTSPLTARYSSGLSQLGACALHAPKEMWSSTLLAHSRKQCSLRYL